MAKKSRRKSLQGERNKASRTPRTQIKPSVFGVIRKAEGAPTRSARSAPRSESRRVAGSKSALALRATVDKKGSGIAFLVFIGGVRPDVFVSRAEASGLLTGDLVEVRLDSRGQIQKLQVLQRRYREMVGRYVAASSSEPRRGGRKVRAQVSVERKRLAERFAVLEDLEGVQTDDWVRGALIYPENSSSAERHPNIGMRLIENYGAELPPATDVTIVALEYQLNEFHSPEAVAEARAHQLAIPGDDLLGRTDLRHLPFFTIDGETARDYDDAIHVEAHAHGEHTLWVAIADVSHYVMEGSALDLDARIRGTSVYFPERAFHMLPQALSENLCSLRPHEPRLALVAKIRFNTLGERIQTEVFSGVIQSVRRATYTEVHAEYLQHQYDPDWMLAPHYQVYEILRAARTRRGSIDFEFPEAETQVEPTGEVISIRVRPRLSAHRLIEEMMIAANEAVTHWIRRETQSAGKPWPFIYRVHEAPSLVALTQFSELARSLGVHINFEGGATPGALSALLQDLEGHGAKDVLSMALLRSMKQAVYSAEHGIHFGLASTGYTHFTSPIRRYPDLVVHRILRRLIQAQNKSQSQSSSVRLGDAQRRALEQELDEVSHYCSLRERLATDAEREALKIKQIRAIAPHVGLQFLGKIVGIIGAGIFVQLQDPFVEGMVNEQDLGTQGFIYDPDRRTFFHADSDGHRLEIGQAVKIQVAAACVGERRVDFHWVGADSKSKKEYAGRTSHRGSRAVKRNPKRPSIHKKHSRQSRPKLR